MSQDTATTATPLLMAVCSGDSPITTTVMMALLGAWAVLAQQDSILSSLLIPRDMRSVLVSPLCCNSYISPRCLFRHIPTMLQVLQRWGFSFIVEPSTVLSKCIYVCYGVCFLLSDSFVDVLLTYGAQLLVFAPPQCLRAYLWQAYAHLGDGLRPTPGIHQVTAPSTAFSKGSLMLLSQLSSSHSSNIVWYRALGA